MGLIRKNNDTVRLYKRGNEDVNLNEYVATAERNFNDWLDSVNIKDKDKPKVRAAYAEIIQHINDTPDQFTARLGGGFTNDFGITNDTSSKTDAYGIAAGYLGNVLRRMQTYVKPEEPSNRLKYDKSKSTLINAAMQQELMGNNPIAFVELDSQNSNGDYSTTNRDKKIVDYLSKVRDNIDDYYDYDSEEDKQQIYNNLNAAITNLTNGASNDDMYTLGQLGFTDLNRYYLTKVPKETVSTPDTSQQSTQQSVPTNTSSEAQLKQAFETWKEQNYKTTTDNSFDKPIDLTTSGKPLGSYYGGLIKNASKELLADALKNYLQYHSNPKYTLSNNASLRQILKLKPTDRIGVRDGDMLIPLLNEIKDRKGFNPIEEGSVKYIISHPIKGTDKVYVWDSSTNRIEQISIHNTKYGRDKIVEEFKKSHGSNSTSDPYAQYFVSSNKKGGVLKAYGGIQLPEGGSTDINDMVFYTPEMLTADKRLKAVLNADKKTIHLEKRGDIPVSDKVAPNNTKYDPEEGGEQWEATPEYGEYLRRMRINPTLAESWARRYRDLQQSISGKPYHSNWFDKENDNFLHNQFNTQILSKDNQHYYNVYNDKVNGPGHDIYRGKVYRIKGDDGKEYYYNNIPEGWEENPDDVDTSRMLEDIYGLRQKSTTNTNPNQKSKSDLDEINTEDKQPSILNKIGEATKNALPGAIALSRLKLSLDSNNKIAKTVKASLRPKLHDTYELYSPITGAFSQMQLMNQQGAEALSQGSKPFTSDASLASARMLEASKYKDQLQQKGFIADDTEIKRTAKEALARVEDNIKRRSALANENRDSIITNNQAVAQLEASRLLKNWGSVDNYLKEIETRLRTKQNERESVERQINKAMLEYANQYDYDTRMNSARNAFLEWKSKNPSGTLADYEQYSNYAYTNASKDAMDTYKRNNLKVLASLYDIPYTLKEPFNWK